ncbi:MAG: NAD-dependent epimerase/dehydratase family protein [Bacteroidota bacterium]
MIFVTGGTGLTGARLLYDLAMRKLPVTALKRHSSSMKIVDYYFNKNKELREYITWTEGDITERDSLEIISAGDEVYHCAGLVSFDPADRDLLYAVNIRGTENIVNVCVEKGVKKLAYVSSVAALGRNSEDSIYITEESHWENDEMNSDYAISKYGGEREVWRGMAEGLNAVIINPTIILGPGNFDKGSMKLISRVDKGLKFYTDGASGYVDVKDVSFIMIALMKSEIRSERFILNAENISYQELFTMISNSLGKKPPSVLATKWMGNMMWRYEWLKKKVTGHPPLITKFSAATAFKKYIYSNEKIATFLNYKFESLEKTVKNVTEVYIKKNR